MVGGNMGRSQLRCGTRASSALALIEQLEKRRLLASTLISLAVRDIVFDDSRDILYVSTSTGLVYRYDLASGTILPPWTVGGSLEGLDLTPDHSTLYVADTNKSATQRLIRKLNTQSRALTTLAYDLAAGDAGA